MISTKTSKPSSSKVLANTSGYSQELPRLPTEIKFSLAHSKPYGFVVVVLGFVLFLKTELSPSFSSFFVTWQTALLLLAGKIYLCKSLFSPASPLYLLTSVINEPKMAMDLKGLYQLFIRFTEVIWKKSKHHFNSGQCHSFTSNILRTWSTKNKRSQNGLPWGLKQDSLILI